MNHLFSPSSTTPRSAVRQKLNFDMIMAEENQGLNLSPINSTVKTGNLNGRIMTTSNQDDRMLALFSPLSDEDFYWATSPKLLNMTITTDSCERNSRLCDPFTRIAPRSPLINKKVPNSVPEDAFSSSCKNKPASLKRKIDFSLDEPSPKKIKATKTTDFCDSNSIVNNPLKWNALDTVPINTRVLRSASINRLSSPCNKMPATPRKTNPGKRTPRELSEFENTVWKVLKQSAYQIQIGDKIKKFKIDPKPIGSGNYCEVFKISAGQKPIFPGIKNENMVFKRYHLESLTREMRNINKCMKTSLAQYNYLKENSPFPIAKWHNSETALTDGFIIEEMLKPYQAKWDCKTQLSELDKKTHSVLKQAKQMIQWAYDNRANTITSIDACKRNLLVDKKNVLKLIDFKEDCSDGFEITVENCVNSLSRGDDDNFEIINPEIKKFLMPSNYIFLD